jgi:RNA recognition motif-containing protein
MEANTTEDELRAAFATYGPVEVTTTIKDRDTGAPRGFDFVEMTADKDAQDAVLGLNGSLIAGRAIVVSVRSEQRRAPLGALRSISPG